MKLIKKGYESLRLTYNGDWDKVKDYEFREKNDKQINELKEEIKTQMFSEVKEKVINFGEEEKYDDKTILEENIEELRAKRNEIMGFIDDFDHIKNIIFNLIDNKNFYLSHNTIHDRDIFKINFIEDYDKAHTIIEINQYFNYRQFGVGSVKLNGMFRRIKEETIWQDVLYEIEDIILKQHYSYLNRIDFYMDMECSMKEFLQNTKLRGFKSGGIIEGGIFKSYGEGFEIKEDSTIYWGKMDRAHKRIVARLYNKWVDTVKKGKMRYYSYLNENIKRFEISVEALETQDWKKIFEGNNVWEFIRFLYKNVVLKQNKLNGYWYYKFDIDILKQEEVIYDNVQSAKKRKRTLKKQQSFKLQHYWGYTRTMLAEMGDEEYMEYLNLIRNGKI